MYKKIVNIQSYFVKCIKQKAYSNNVYTLLLRLISQSNIHYSQSH